MWQDPVVKETRKLRDQYAAQFNYDADAIFQDILKRQNESGRKRVSFPPRKPQPIVPPRDICDLPADLSVLPGNPV